ncbi:MAG: diadenylate cyclase CdaA [Treponema sp.]|nr:diadenylate cyclase CdaA [Treponema sp.]MBR4631550.1 diadenylate cyclase CdaA [Treponema sp.]MBR6913236.1 diadenylate cyclase CdaA [Treponema sp.]
MNSVDTFVAAWSSIKTIFDICVLTGVLYAVYQILAKTGTLQIVRAVLVILFVYIIVFVLRLEVMMFILREITPALAVGLAVIFQDEIKKFIQRIGQMNLNFLQRDTRNTDAYDVVIAAEALSKKKKGMLVVFERGTRLDNLIESGTKLNADISSALLLTIFSFETALHDAACIVRDGRIVAAGCFLPLTNRNDLDKTFGTRHRAAIGTSEQTDAVVLIVSEETGAMSLAYDSKFDYDLTTDQLMTTLERLLNNKPQKSKESASDEDFSDN